MVCKLLVWLYIRLWYCPVLTKNSRQKSVLYPSLQNVVADIRGNNDVNLAGFTLEQYKKPTSFVEAIEVAFYTTNCYPSSSFHNKIPFMIYNSVLDPTYQFWNIHFVQLSDLWRFLPQMWTLSPPKIFFLEAVPLIDPTFIVEQKLVGWATQALRRPKQRKKTSELKTMKLKSISFFHTSKFPRNRRESKRIVWVVKVSFWKNWITFSTVSTYLRVSWFKLTSGTIRTLQNA